MKAFLLKIKGLRWKWFLVLAVPVLLFLIGIKAGSLKYLKEEKPKKPAIENKSRDLKSKEEEIQNKKYEEYFKKGIESFKTDDLAGATESLEQARKIKDTDELREMLTQIYSLMGYKSLKADKPKEAGSFFEKSFEISQDIQAVRGLAAAHLAMRDYDNAEKDLERILEKEPGDTSSLELLEEIKKAKEIK